MMIATAARCAVGAYDVLRQSDETHNRHLPTLAILYVGHLLETSIAEQLQRIADELETWNHGGNR